VHVLRRILDILLPTACSYCSSSVGDSGVPFFCSACWNDFAVMSGPLCPSCGRQFESSEALRHSPDHCCLDCRKQTPFFDQAVSIGYFEGPLREAIHQFKYRPCRSLGVPLGRWMAENLGAVRAVDLVIPVPLHSSRLRQRGFNQALLLANQVADSFSLPLCYDNLVRLKRTKPQVELSPEERLQNVKNAFSMLVPDRMIGKSVLIVDDVYTTGATMNECSRILKEAGAVRVSALTIARAV